MHAVPVRLLVAALCASALSSAAGDAFVPAASATVGPDGVAGAETARGRYQMLAPRPGRTMAPAGETATIFPQDYLTETNAWRAEVGAPPLVWDETIAKVSQSWAEHLKSDGCDMVHSSSAWQKEAYKAAGGPEEFLGENIAWACCSDPPKQDGKQVVDMWASEKKSFSYGPLGEECTSHDGGTTGHYTQLVWAKSEKMGCGMATCGDKGTVWVCNFYPSGNWMGEAPFCKAALPADMPTCPSLPADLGEDMPCAETAGTTKCGYEEKCCSCESTDTGDHDIEEGEEDEKSGKSDEAAGENAHDPVQVQEGKDEIRAGEIEEDHGRDEEREYLMNHEFHKVVEVTGLDAEHFDEVKFQSALAEVLGVPLFDVTVGAINGGARRRLLAADSLDVPVTLKCDGRVECKRLLGQLEGITCNGALARALSDIFGLTIRTPGCKAYKAPLSSFDPENAHSVTFPDAYPNSVRHWLLIGALSMMLGAGLVFVFTFVPSRTPPMASVVVFIICAVSMCAYYCMWAGESEENRYLGFFFRRIFLAIGHFVTTHVNRDKISPSRVP